MKTSYSKFYNQEVVKLKRAYAGWPAGEYLTVVDNRKRMIKKNYCILLTDAPNSSNLAKGRFVPTKYLRRI